MVYKGHVKSYNADRGWGFISCAATEKLYGKDIILLRKNKGDCFVKPGDVVDFDVVDGEKGPEAVGIVIIDERGFPPVLAKEKKKGYYVGNVKSYNAGKGWGFVSCEETFAMFEKDVFLMRAKDKGVLVNPGDRVRFTVRDGEKGPEVDDLELLSRDNPGEVLSRPPSEYSKSDRIHRERLQEATGSYRGTIKSFNAAKGWGFIRCEETERMYNKDILVHKKNCGSVEFEPGESVTFSVMEGEKGPEAANIKRRGGNAKAATSKVARAESYGVDYREEYAAEYGAMPVGYMMAKGGPMPAGYMMAKGDPWGKGCWGGDWGMGMDAYGEGYGCWAYIPMPMPVKGKGKGYRTSPYA